MEKVSKRVNAIKEVKESVMLLTQLLGDYSKEPDSHSNDELIKVCKSYAYISIKNTVRAVLRLTLNTVRPEQKFCILK